MMLVLKSYNILEKLLHSDIKQRGFNVELKKISTKRTIQKYTKNK